MEAASWKPDVFSMESLSSESSVNLAIKNHSIFTAYKQGLPPASIILTTSPAACS
jgi:hypothetical protein